MSEFDAINAALAGDTYTIDVGTPGVPRRLQLTRVADHQHLPRLWRAAAVVLDGWQGPPTLPRTIELTLTRRQREGLIEWAAGRASDAPCEATDDDQQMAGGAAPALRGGVLQ